KKCKCAIPRNASRSCSTSAWTPSATSPTPATRSCSYSTRRMRMTETEKHYFDYFECPECGFDSVQLASFNGSENCPQCAGDTGRDVAMRRRPARASDHPEGRDARVE